MSFTTFFSVILKQCSYRGARCLRGLQRDLVSSRFLTLNHFTQVTRTWWLRKNDYPFGKHSRKLFFCPFTIGNMLGLS